MPILSTKTRGYALSEILGIQLIEDSLQHTTVQRTLSVSSIPQDLPAGSSTTSLTKFLRPLLEFLETLLADTRSDIDQTGLEIFELNRSNLVHRHI